MLTNDVATKMLAIFKVLSDDLEVINNRDRHGSMYRSLSAARFCYLSGMIAFSEHNSESEMLRLFSIAVKTFSVRNVDELVELIKKQTAESSNEPFRHDIN